ncbi:MAG TPA: type 1 glutamine amidotransferase domain-containing protein [Chthonomonadaceae bacterium]|nr:type 1 glutamine amidotransferase domain-containing protein [Chthonomonadaceae bacterium]
MSVSIDVLYPDNPKRVLMIAANPAVSPVTGWPVGVWASEVIHPYYEFTEQGYRVEIASPQGGKLELDSWSDPRDASKYSEDDLISLGFLSSPKYAPLLENTRRLDTVNPADYDVLFVCGGQSPMVTFIEDTALHKFIADFYESGKVVAIICHGTCTLLKITLSNGKRLVEGKTWTGFANSEEDYADAFVGRRIQPFRIEDEAHKLTGTNFIVNSRFRAYAVRDGRLITGQQQYSAREATRLVVEALGR